MSRSVLDKLGFRAGTRTAIWRLPDALAPIFADASLAAGEPPRWLIAFAKDNAAVAEAAHAFAPRYVAGGHLWLCYPKKTGRIDSDIDRDKGWEPVAALGLLPVTQVAIDDMWSALRWRRREEIAKLTRKF